MTDDANVKVSDLHAVRNFAIAGVVVALVIGLPLAVWLDMSRLSETNLRRQALDFSKVIGLVRDFYARDVVARILDNEGKAIFSHKFREIKGGVPVPATFSIELANLLHEDNINLGYRFVSDFPFTDRRSHNLSDFELRALNEFRAEPRDSIHEFSGGLFSRSLKFAVPVYMQQACVNCHNTHPNSPKTDWKVGDVRGIQVFSVAQPISLGFGAFRSLLIYFVVLVVTGGAFIYVQANQSKTIQRSNSQLARLNGFLEGLTNKLSVYLSPQIFKFIFSGDKEIAISTDRKKLTIFFSDIKDFTATTEAMQPEELAALLNEYLTEMSEIALKHGATIDKYIGDAIMVFFGDPETKGVAEDAKACLRMAVEMQDRLRELNVKWRRAGVTKPFQTRMGINTGFCNVGNFGSEKRMDYTIIGGEANLAARLEGLAEPGEIVISSETYALTSDVVAAEAGDPVFVKGIGREIVPYRVTGLLDGQGERRHVVARSLSGMELYIDLDAADGAELDRLIEEVSALRIKPA